MIKVGILGASGFIGARLVETFHLRGVADVVAIVRRPASLAPVGRFDVEWRFADALDEAALTQAFRGCDVIVHSVMGNLGQIPLEPQPAYRAAERAGVGRIVYLSSAAVHGQNPAPGTDESSPIDWRQSFRYNLAKAEAERRFQRLRKHGSVELVTLRPSIVFGPGDAWITGMAEALAQHKPYLVGGGHGICNTTYVDNLVHAVRLALTGSGDKEACLVVDAETVTWRELYAQVARELFHREPDPSIYDYDTLPADLPLKDRLRWSPAYRSIKRHLPVELRARLGRTAGAVLGHGSASGRRNGNGLDPHTDSARAVVPYEWPDLHRCAWKLPYAKARRILEYEPVVSVEEGMRRTLAWLRAMRPDFWIHSEEPASDDDAPARDLESETAFMDATEALGLPTSRT